MVDPLLEHAFFEIEPHIEGIVTQARARGLASKQLAMLCEVPASGSATIVCNERAEIARKLRTGKRGLTFEALAKEVLACPVTELPVALIVHQGEDVVGGVRRVHLGPPVITHAAFRIDDHIESGSFLVRQIGAKPGESPTAWLDRACAWVNANPRHPRVAELRLRLEQPHASYDVGWNVAWAVEGFQRVQVGHKLAASLMATHAGDDPEALTCKPWNAYTIEIPPELLRVPGDDGTTISYDVICVWHHPDEGETLVNIYSRSSPNVISGKIRALAFPDDDESFPEGEAWLVASRRALECVYRLIIGTELEMSSPEQVKRPPGASRPIVPGKPIGVHRLMREVRIDCREAVAAFLAGQRRDPGRVRRLVRGHWRRVAFGPRQTLRRWQQIEPYWAGPEAGPAGVRAHRVVDEEFRVRRRAERAGDG